MATKGGVFGFLKKKKSAKKITFPELKPLDYDAFLALKPDFDAMCQRSKEAFAGKAEILKEVVKMIKSIPVKENSQRLFFVFRGDHPMIATAVVSMSLAPECAMLCFLLSDGSTKGIGRQAIGDVASWSELAGRKGLVRLVPDTDGLEKYYASLGFKITSDGFLGKEMTLDPRANKQLWHLDKGRWVPVH